ncbi:MAG: hypothetical protein ABI588_07270 [Arenimonas sp.]
MRPFIARRAFLPEDGTAVEALQGVVMAKLMLSAFSVFLLAALQAGCAASPARPVGFRSSPEPIHPTCDTSVGAIELLGRITNPGGDDIAIHLDDQGGPPFDPSYMAYRVHASAPGEPFQLVHNSGHDSQWDRSITIAPGDSAMFNIPIFGLRPSDFYHYFRIEFRDARNRSYWTQEFELCAMSAANCACRGGGATAANALTPRQGCAAAPQAKLVKDDAAGGLSLVCR